MCNTCILSVICENHIFALGGGRVSQKGRLYLKLLKVLRYVSYPIFLSILQTIKVNHKKNLCRLVLLVRGYTLTILHSISNIFDFSVHSLTHLISVRFQSTPKPRLQQLMVNPPRANGSVSLSNATIPRSLITHVTISMGSVLDTR